MKRRPPRHFRGSVWRHESHRRKSEEPEAKPHLIHRRPEPHTSRRSPHAKAPRPRWSNWYVEAVSGDTEVGFEALPQVSTRSWHPLPLAPCRRKSELLPVSGTLRRGAGGRGSRRYLIAAKSSAACGGQVSARSPLGRMNFRSFGFHLCFLLSLVQRKPSHGRPKKNSARNTSRPRSSDERFFEPRMSTPLRSAADQLPAFC